MKPMVTEKAVMLIEGKNTLVFEIAMAITKSELRREFEEMFKVKVEKINTLIKKNKKYAYIKLNKNNPAIDVATKLGLI